LIDRPQNVRQGLKKQALITHLNPFEFFSHCRKQIEIIGS
jgi:hypothetical protein